MSKWIRQVVSLTPVIDPKGISQHLNTFEVVRIPSYQGQVGLNGNRGDERVGASDGLPSPMQVTENQSGKFRCLEIERQNGVEFRGEFGGQGLDMRVELLPPEAVDQLGDGDYGEGEMAV